MAATIFGCPKLHAFAKPADFKISTRESTKVGRTVGVVTAIEEQLVNSRAPDILQFISARIYAQP